jgi:dienelactone hydrolase
MRVFPLLLLVLLLLPAGSAAAAFDPAYEQQNYAKQEERFARDGADPAFQALLRQKGLENQVYREQLRVEDPERDASGNLCANKQDGCAGEVRLYDWAAAGFGLREPVQFVARSGAVISGHVWRTKAGPAKRPGIVITNGSVQAPEELYWAQAAVLAKRGYVVLTFDPQGQGYSDTYGEGADRNEGFPSQSGRPFFDQTEDALDFFLSGPGAPYVPRKSCTTGTSHADKHQRRVAAGKGTAFNPFAAFVDADRIGLSGHSFGAAGVSFVAATDPRVDAVVGWDNLRSADTAPASDCASAPESRKPGRARVPALGMSNDYGLFRQPNTAEPDPLSHSEGSLAYSKAGEDTAQINLRGGTHYEYSYIANAFFGATLRGLDVVSFYTAAWFDKYLRRDPGADAKLLTTRWHADAPTAAVDPGGDGNLFSGYLRSRMDIRLAGGKRFTCEDLRAAKCPGLGADGGPAAYSYLTDANTPDVLAGAVVRAPRSSARCSSRRSFLVRLRAPKGDRVVRASVRVGSGRPRISRGRSITRVRVDLRGRRAGRVTVRISVRTRSGRTFTVVRRYRTCVRR